MGDIRECFVWLEYTNGHTAKLKGWLDIDECIEQQIRMSFESPPAAETGPKLANFKWDLVNRGFSLGEYEQEAHQ